MKIAVGLSGGVDSSVTAALLKEQHHDVHGIFMQNWTQQGEQCSIEADWEDAQRVAEILGIPITKLDFSEIYWNQVFEFFLQELERGRTPSPDILCNQYVKFGSFWQWAKDQGYDRVATGHYASLTPDHKLQQASDPKKDQTYFLWSVPPSTWTSVLFPLGGLIKSEVRILAERYHLPTAQKKDSTGVCFIGPKNFKGFLKRYLLSEPGPIQTESGLVIGRHEGLFGSTLGQRGGLGIGGVKGALESPWYVIAKDLRTNTITVSQNPDHDALLGHSLWAESCVWQNEICANQPLWARIRHGQELQECEIDFLEGRVFVRFQKAQRAITPGQAVVFYQNGLCCGGGWISHHTAPIK